MTETLTQILMIEIIVAAHVILAFAFLKMQQPKADLEQDLAEEAALNAKAKALYEESNKSDQLSLSLGREESQSSSRPSSFHFVCESGVDDWVLTS